MANKEIGSTRTIMGFSLLSFVHTFAGVMYAMFLQYLTDYSGIDSAIGKVGFAAGFGTVILLITRIIDGIDDPIQAYIIDGAKETKFGKYRKFTIIGVIAIAVGIIGLFAMPQFVKSNARLLYVWVIFFYLLYDIGTAWNGTGPLLQKHTYDPNVRTKIVAFMRVALIVAALPGSFFIAIVTGVSKSTGNIGATYSVICAIITIISAAISILGVLLLKEPENKYSEEHTPEKLSIKAVFEMFKKNKPVWIHTVGYILQEFSGTISGIVMVYFIKWVYCADLTTGVVNNDLYAAYYSMLAIVGIIPTFVCPFLSIYAIKKVGSVDKTLRIFLLASGIGYFVFFLTYITGLLQASIFVCLVMRFILSITSGMTAIPMMLMWTECSDYAEYTAGRSMSALVSSVEHVISKFQMAVSGVVPGVILVLVGYSVNAETGVYEGNLANLPHMITGFSIIYTLLPAVLLTLAWFIYKKLYPLDQKKREEITGILAERRAKYE